MKFLFVSLLFLIVGLMNSIKITFELDDNKNLLGLEDFNEKELNKIENLIMKIKKSRANSYKNKNIINTEENQKNKNKLLNRKDDTSNFNSTINNNSITNNSNFTNNSTSNNSNNNTDSSKFIVLDANKEKIANLLYDINDSNKQILEKNQENTSNKEKLKSLSEKLSLYENVRLIHIFRI